MKFWKSPIPKTCDLCGQPVFDTFIDGRTSEGFWAIMCKKCHVSKGMGLGPGRGQLYCRNRGGKFLKTDG